MNKAIALFLLALCMGAFGQDVISETKAPFTERGVTITKFVDGAETSFVNEASEPWYPVSVWSDNSGRTNTITISVVRVYDTRFQYRPDDVTTNILGMVLTNTYTEVTNVFTRVLTNAISGTVTGAASFAVSPVFMIKADDIIRIGQTDTNGKPVVINGLR